MASSFEGSKQLGLDVYQILTEAGASDKKERRDSVRCTRFSGRSRFTWAGIAYQVSAAKSPKPASDCCTMRT